jgi:hypothetical protein
VLPEHRIFGGFAVFAIGGAIWIALDFLFGTGTGGALFGGLFLLLVVVALCAFVYDRAKSLAGWMRERLWWWRGPDSAIRAILRWREKDWRHPAGLIEVLRALPDCQVNARSLDGETALHAAIRLNSFLGAELMPVVEHLLAAGADRNAPDRYDGKTPLDYVAFYGAPAEIAARLSKP